MKTETKQLFEIGDEVQLVGGNTMSPVMTVVSAGKNQHTGEEGAYLIYFNGVSGLFVDKFFDAKLLELV